MPQDETQINPQDINNDLTPDEAAAALSFATMLSEQMMPKAQPESPQMQETGLPQDETLESDKMAMEQEHEAKMAEIDKKMEDMKKEMQEMIKSEMSNFKEIISEALKDDDKEG